MKCSTAPFNPCPTTPNAQCVVYTGANLPNINVTTNMRLDTILSTLNSIVNNFEFNLFTEDSITVDFSGDGSSNTPLTADVIVSDFGNNAILVLETGLYVPNTVQNGVVLGGIVTWLQDYEYHVSPAVYYIDGVRFDQRETFPNGFNFTLDPPDGTFNRIDTFAVDTDGNTVVLEGTPSVDPAQAPLDTATQLQLSIALVETGTTEPTIDVECIYKNNLEGPLWLNVSSTSRLDPDSTNTPCNGTKTIEGTSVITGDNILFTRSSNFIPGASHSLVTFLIRSKGFSGNNNFLRLQWEFNGTPVGTSVALRNLAFGFQGLDTTNCQVVSIPFSFFGITTVSIVNSFRITGSVAAVGGIGFYIDDLCIQGQPLPDSPTNVDEKVKVSSNDTTAGYLNGKLVAGAGVTLTELNNGANETLSISVTTTLSADNGLSESPTNNVQIGGSALIQNSSIFTSAFHLDIASSANTYTFKGVNTGSGNALEGEALSSGGTGGYFAGAAYGIAAYSAAGSGVQAYSDSGIPLEVVRNTATTNAPVRAVQIVGQSTGTAADGFGSYIEYIAQTDLGNQAISNQLISNWTTAADATRTSQFIITGVDSAVTADLLTLSGSGALQLNNYGAGTFTGTDTFWLAVDTNGNVIEVAAPVGASVTADNGLSINPAGNVQLGGLAYPGEPLLHNTYIDGDFYGLYLTSEVAAVEGFSTPAVFTVENTISGFGYGINVDMSASSSGSGIRIEGNSGGGGWGIDIVEATGGIRISNENAPSFEALNVDPNNAAITIDKSGHGGQIFSGSLMSAIVTGSSTNSIDSLFYLTRGTTGTAADGIGSGITFVVQTDSGSNQRANVIASRWADATNATRLSEFVIMGADSADVAEIFAFKGDGILQGYNYGSGSFSGTPTYAIAVDADGNFIETALGGGGGSITADNGLTMSTSTNAQLGGTLLQDTLVANGAFQFDFTGTHANYVFGVNNNAAGTAGDFQSAGGTAVLGTGILGGVFTGVTGVTGLTTTNGGLAGTFSGTFSTTTTKANVIDVQRHTSGTPDTGLGATIQYTLEATASTIAAGSLSVSWTDAISASATSHFEISLLDTGVSGRKLSLEGDGQLGLDEYGVGTFTGTDAFWLAVDSGGNVIEMPAPAGATAITADNGLTANTSTNVRLGGTLLADTTINGTGSFRLLTTSSIINGAATATLQAANTGAGQAFYAVSGAGNAIKGESTSAIGIFGTSTSGVGAQGNSTSGVGIQGFSVSGMAGVFTVEPTSTNTTVVGLQLVRNTTGTAANGIGTSFDFFLETTTSGDASNRLISTWTDATNATRTSQFILTGVNSAIEADVLTIEGNGAAKLNAYGSGAITGGSPTFALNVDASGNIIEAALGSGMTNPMGAIGDIITSSDGAGTPVAISPGAAGTVLTSNGAGSQPTYQAVGAGSGIVRVVVSTAAPLTMGAIALTDYVYFVSGTTTVTLPTAVGNSNRYSVTRTDASLTTTIDTTGGQTIDGSSTQTLNSQFESVDLMSNGSNWFII